MFGSLLRNRPKKIKLVTSDMHLSAGVIYEGKPNPYEDFFYDQEFVGFLRFFSTGDFAEGCEVELILNGDVLDFLNVPIDGEFPEEITEEMAIRKLKAILAGHPEVVEALKAFCAKPKKRIIYNVGNHDPEFFFPAVRRLFCETIGGSDWHADKIWVNAETEYLEYPEGIEVHHGNQFEAVHMMNFRQPLITENVTEPILSIPWGTTFVLKIINRVKWEREYVDKVKPIKIFILFGLFTDTLFILKFMLLSAFYFLRTRFVYNPKRKATIWNTLRIMQEEITPFHGLEDDARAILDQKPHANIVIFGHTHGAMQQRYRDGKVYINTGTWTRMVNLDLRHLGQTVRLTFALVEYDEKGAPTATLQEWVGEHAPHKLYNG